MDDANQRYVQSRQGEVALDLKSDHGRAEARRLLDGADVAVENFRPGVMDRLGLGARDATERNPRLIYCSLPGFAGDDPRASLAAWEGVLLDLKAPEGRDVFWRLVEGADVVMQNFRLGVAERLGVGYEQVRARRRDIVYGSVSFCGYGGPWERVPGYEPNAQAATGMAARMGGEDGPPGPQPFAPNDYATGLLGAFAVGLALFHRQRTGEGQHVQTSLVAAATVLQAALIAPAGGPVEAASKAPPALGWSPLQRLYRASDGWFFLGAGDAHADRLAALDGLHGIAGRQGVELETALQECFAKRPAREWVDVLTAAGLGAHELRSPIELMGDPWVVAHGLSLTRADAKGDAITTIGPPFRLSRTPVVPGSLVAAPGADGAEVLRNLGMADRIDELVAKRVMALE